MIARRRDRGAIAVELPLAVGVLLLPVAALVMTLPRWPEAKTIAITIAQEAATLYADAPNRESAAAAAQAAVDTAATNYGLAITAAIPDTWCRGCLATITVTIEVPAIDVPIIGSTGLFEYTATATARIGDYRSQG